MCSSSVTVFLRKWKVQVYLNLEDWLIKDHTREQVEADVGLIRSTFDKLGLLNIQKSTLSSIQRVEFIRAVLDSGQARVFLLEFEFQAICAIIKGLRSYPITMAQNCLKFMGHMAVCTYAI